jgi:hypothetical protein
MTLVTSLAVRPPAALEDVGKYSSVCSLKLQNCRDLFDTSLAFVAATFKKLVRLDISGCSMTDFSLLSTLPSLNMLHIGDRDSTPGARLAGRPRITADDLKKLPVQLKGLSIEYCPAITGDGLYQLEHLTNLVNLTVLSLSLSLSLPLSYYQSTIIKRVIIIIIIIIILVI